MEKEKREDENNVKFSCSVAKQLYRPAGVRTYHLWSVSECKCVCVTELCVMDKLRSKCSDCCT